LIIFIIWLFIQDSDSQKNIALKINKAIANQSCAAKNGRNKITIAPTLSLVAPRHSLNE
jgi:hypothetical protein